MFYVGLDIHSKYITICILNQNGKVHRRCSVRQLDQMMNVLERLPRPFQVCYEASTGYGFFFELLSPVANEVWRPDAAGSSGSNRMMSYGAPPRRMMPNGRMELPASARSFLTENSSWTLRSG